VNQPILGNLMLSPTPKATPPNIFSHWFQMIEGLQFSPSTFYETVEQQVKERGIPNVKIKQVTCSEGGTFSAKRIYLRVKRKEIIFDICGAPFGKGFFVSWWLGEKPRGIIHLIASYLAYVPFVGIVVSSMFQKTYFKIDSMLMFQQSVHAAVTEVVDAIVSEQGLRPLTELQKTPKMNL
jgi:hypothetical protein